MIVDIRLENGILHALEENPSRHIEPAWFVSTLDGGGITRADGRILVTRGGLRVFFHRYLYEKLIGPLGKLQLMRTCEVWGCQNPRHYESVVRPKQPMSPGSAPWRKKNQAFCLHGHSLADAYLYTDKRGWAHRNCRTCKLERQAQYRSTNR